MPHLRVLACGNPEAGDDAAGLLAVRALRPGLAGLDGVEVIEVGPAVQVLLYLQDVEVAVVVDAVRTRGVLAPGEMVRLEVGPDGLPAAYRAALSSHGLGLHDTIGLAAALGPLPRIVFFGVEVADVSAGPPSPEVARAIPELADRVVNEVLSLEVSA